jgi:hypothetical protein
MRTWQFLSTKPSEGWGFATSLFGFSWSMTTLTPLFIFWTPKGEANWAQLCLLATWIVSSCFVFGTFTNLTRLADRVRQLEETAGTSRQPS